MFRTAFLLVAKSAYCWHAFITASAMHLDVFVHFGTRSRQIDQLVVIELSPNRVACQEFVGALLQTFILSLDFIESWRQVAHIFLPFYEQRPVNARVFGTWIRCIRRSQPDSSKTGYKMTTVPSLGLSGRADVMPGSSRDG